MSALVSLGVAKKGCRDRHIYTVVNQTQQQKGRKSVGFYGTCNYLVVEFTQRGADVNAVFHTSSACDVHAYISSFFVFSSHY